MNARRVAELHREIARLHGELARELELAREDEAPPPEPRREVTDIDRARAREKLRRLGVDV